MSHAVHHHIVFSCYSSEDHFSLSVFLTTRCISFASTLYVSPGLQISLSASLQQNQFTDLTNMNFSSNYKFC